MNVYMNHNINADADADADGDMEAKLNNNAKAIDKAKLDNKETRNIPKNIIC